MFWTQKTALYDKQLGKQISLGKSSLDDFSYFMYCVYEWVDKTWMYIEWVREWMYGQVLYNRAWKKWYFASFFRNISKTAETILIKKK